MRLGQVQKGVIWKEQATETAEGLKSNPIYVLQFREVRSCSRENSRIKNHLYKNIFKHKYMYTERNIQEHCS